MVIVMIKVYTKALDVFQNKVTLLKKTKKNIKDIVSAYSVHITEAYSDTEYFFVRLITGEMGLYLLPGLKLIAGDDVIDKKTYNKIKIKEYKNIEELTTEEPTEVLFNRLKADYQRNAMDKTLFHPYAEGFSYLTSLYYGENESVKPAFEKLFRRLQKECDNLGIPYDTNPQKILSDKLKIQKEQANFKLNDVTVCSSKEKIDEYFNQNIYSCTDSKKMERELTNFNFIRIAFITAFNGEFLVKSDRLISALEDRNYPNRESILKNYMEFFIAKDYAFDLVNYADKKLEEGNKIQANLAKERFNKNFEFIENLEKLVSHDKEKETYRYHATTSREAAIEIMEEGFYSYSENLDSTSFQEFDVNTILNYSYGNGLNYFGDYIIVISEPKGEDILTKLTEEEKENISILPRRDAMIGNKPGYQVDKKHIVAIIDKEHERVIMNPEYQNRDKKQI